MLFAPLFDLLLKFELSVELEVPAEPATAVSFEPEALLASVVVPATVPAREAFEALVLLALAFRAALAVEELVAALVLLAVFEAVAPLMFDALLLADSVAFRLLLELALVVSDLVLEEVSVFDELLEAL